MSSNPILDALNLLRIAYPRERVDVWAVGNPSQEQPEYVAAVGAGGGDNPVFTGGHRTPAEAAEALIANAGDRDPARLLDQKIARLRAELATLEGAQPKTETEVAS